MSETYQITKEQYNFLMKQNEKANKRKEKDKLRKERRKTYLKKYHQSDKGKAAKLKAQRKWRAKQRAQ